MKERPTLYQKFPDTLGYYQVEGLLEAMPMEDIMLLISDTFQVKEFRMEPEATVVNSVFSFGITIEFEHPECFVDAGVKPLETYERSASSMTSVKKALINIALKMWGHPTMFSPWFRTADAFMVYPYTKEDHGQDPHKGARCQRCGRPMDGSRRVNMDEPYSRWLCHNESCPRYTEPD